MNCNKELRIPLTTEELVKASILNKKETDPDQVYYLDLVLKDYSDIRTKLYIFPNKNVTEESVKKQYYGIKDIKMIGFRLRLMVMMINKLKLINEYVFYFKYPRLSFAILFFLIFFTYFFDMEFAAGYALIAGISLFIFTSQYYNDKIHPLVSRFLLNEMHPLFEKQRLQNEEILRNVKNEIKFEEDAKKKRKLSKIELFETDYHQFEILTRNMLQEKKNLEELRREEFNYKDEIEDEEVEEEEKEKDENLKDKISNYFTAKSKKSGLALALEGVSNICFTLDSACTVLEKIKNLILWKNKTASMYVMFIM